MRGSRNKEPVFSQRYGAQAYGNAAGGSSMLMMADQKFTRGLWVLPHHETVYNLENSKIVSFSAFVGITEEMCKNSIRDQDRRVNFEVWVDGKIREQSGLLAAYDKPRLLVVEHLENAKELKLVTRLDSDRDNPSFAATWADANFYLKE